MREPVRMPSPFRFDRTWELDAPPAEVWAGMGRTDEFPGWFSWLRELDGDGLHEGAVARCVIQAPLAYSLRLEVHVRHVQEERRVDAAVRGDLDGPARIEIAPAVAGSVVRLQFELDLRAPILRGLSVVARPMMVWAHDRVCDAAVAQFRRHALTAPSTQSRAARAGPAPSPR